jgi:cell division protease FtsH
MTTHKNYSEATAVEIDTELRRIVDDNYARVKKMLGDNVDVLHRISLALIEKENLSGAEIDEIMKKSDSPVAEAAEQAPQE